MDYINYSGLSHQLIKGIYMFLVDSHCHLDSLNYTKIHSNVADALAKAKMRDIKLILSVCTTLPGFHKMSNIIGIRKDVLLSCGVHPLHIDHTYNLKKLRQLGSRAEVIALGETGLDYCYRQDNKLEQQTVFREHIQVGCEYNKPIIIHTRNACSDTIAILKEEHADKCCGVIHCFTEDRYTASLLLDMGFYISFSGISTFNNAQALHNTIRYVPLDRIMIETDSPYLAPMPYRGKENQPSYLRDIAEFIAQLKGVPLEVLAESTTFNFFKLFHIDTYRLISVAI